MKKKERKIETGFILLAVYPDSTSKIVIADRIWNNIQGLHFTNIKDTKGRYVCTNCDLFKIPKKEIKSTHISYPTGILTK
jgi:hypothetical protein